MNAAGDYKKIINAFKTNFENCLRKSAVIAEPTKKHKALARIRGDIMESLQDALHKIWLKLSLCTVFI